MVKLEDMRLFQNLPRTDIEQLYAVFVPVFHDADTVLFREGEEGDTVFLIQQGAVRISKTVDHGAGPVDETLAICQAGDFFGEMAMFGGNRRTATASTQAPTLLLRVTKDQFLGLLAKRPHISLTLAAALCNRLHEANLFALGVLERKNQELAQFNASLELLVNDRTRELQMANEQLWHMAHRDELTDCFNRRHFFNIFEHQAQVSVRYGRPLSLLVLDVDHFKNVNDRLGHQSGDEVLKGIVLRLQQTIRGVDLLARVGGEEFAVLMPETNYEQALLAAERLLRVVNRTPFSGTEFANETVTMSIGVSSVGPKDLEVEGADVVFKRADAALYRAKNRGRNQVCGTTLQPVAAPVTA